MAESLEEILDRATDQNNTADNKAAAQSFADQVNREFDGPQRAIKLIAQKIALHNEIVTLQTLNVLECCVESCGQKFHQEVGRYRFLNELIKLLSPKYDGNITSQTVKTQLIKLLYGWSVGLPLEVKISEAYKMLKQQGIIKRDPIPDSQEAMISRPRNTALEDEEKSQLLSTLLKSSNPEDLQAANRLIKTMVKQEEERLEKFSKRVQELETVSNNVTLLNEMLAAYNSSIPENEKETMKYLYESCLNMRTQLFRMASSSADDKDDTLSEILALSDDLTKAIDEYKLIVLQGGQPTQPKPKKTEQETTKGDYRVTSHSAATADSLLDLGLDLQNANTALEGSVTPTTDTSSSLLDEQFKLLGLDSGISQSNSAQAHSQVSTDGQWGTFTAGSSLQQQQQQQQHPQMQMPGPYNYSTNSAIPYSMNANMSGQMIASNINTIPSGMMPNIRPVSSFASSTGMSQTTKTRGTKPSEPKKYNDPLAFDVFSNFKKDEIKPSSNDNTKLNQQESSLNIEKSNEEEAISNTFQTNNNAAADTLLDFSVSEEEKNSPNQHQDQTSSDGYVVPLEAIEPTSHPPITALDQDGVKTILNIVKDKRETANPNVIVAVLSTISTNVTGISDFRIEISVPKVMRVKMQPPSSTNLPPFNPLFPPSAITQIILIANPSKEKIRMQFRISYKSGAGTSCEIVTIDSLPVT